MEQTLAGSAGSWALAEGQVFCPMVMQAPRPGLERPGDSFLLLNVPRILGMNCCTFHPGILLSRTLRGPKEPRLLLLQKTSKRL